MKLAVTRDQAALNNTRQAEVVLDQLAKRIVRGSEVDPRLTNILAKYGLNVTLEVDGKMKSYPCPGRSGEIGDAALGWDSGRAQMMSAGPDEGDVVCIAGHRVRVSVQGGIGAA